MHQFIVKKKTEILFEVGVTFYIFFQLENSTFTQEVIGSDITDTTSKFKTISSVDDFIDSDTVSRLNSSASRSTDGNVSGNSSIIIESNVGVEELAELLQLPSAPSGKYLLENILTSSTKGQTVLTFYRNNKCLNSAMRSKLVDVYIEHL